MAEQTFAEAFAGVDINANTSKFAYAVIAFPSDPIAARRHYEGLGPGGQAQTMSGFTARMCRLTATPGQLLLSPSDSDFLRKLLIEYQQLKQAQGGADRMGVLEARLAEIRAKQQQVDNSFYMVFAEGGYGPNKKHKTFASAEGEAQRIARQDGKTTYVLRADEKIVPTTTLAQTDLRVQPTNVTPFGPGSGDSFTTHAVSAASA